MHDRVNLAEEHVVLFLLYKLTNTVSIEVGSWSNIELH